MSRRLTLALCIAVFLVQGSFLRCLAGKGPAYRYGEAWWEEYEADKETLLLLHFGKPTIGKDTELASHIKAEKELEELSVTADDGLPGLDPAAAKKVRVSDDGLQAGEVQDYGIEGRRHKLSAGQSIVPDGRFGSALKCSGSGGTLIRSVQSQRAQAMECWFKVEKLPTAPVCILSANNDEGRVLLLPDGRLQLKLAQSHGTPSEKENAPEMLQLILAKRSDIISPDPIEPKTWVHVMGYTHFPVIQGGGQPFVAFLKVNGDDVAEYRSEMHNAYNFMNSGFQKNIQIMIGNSFDQKQPFSGLIDEVRVSLQERDLYARPALPWRDADAKRPLSFDKPAFLQDGTVFHASLNKGAAYDFHKAGEKAIGVDLKGGNVEGLATPGIRGNGWAVNPDIGLPRLSLKGMSYSEGSLEFWVRPVNWDNHTGYWQHSPPNDPFLSILRFYGKTADAPKKLYMDVSLERARNNEQKVPEIDPGHWMHIVLAWDNREKQRLHVYLNGRKWWTKIFRAKPEELAGLQPEYLEIGVSTLTASGAPVTVMREEKPKIAIDEIVGYNYTLAEPEVMQAYKRWQGELAPIPFHACSIEYKWSIAKLEFSIETLLPREITPAKLVLNVTDAAGKPLAGALEEKIEANKGGVLVSSGTPLAPGKYNFAFKVLDAAGKTAIDATQEFNLKREEWRDCKVGILDKTPAPWTPIKISSTDVETRMTKYKLAPDGLPAQIVADGGELLAAPAKLLEDGQPLAGACEMLGSKDVEASWKSLFKGRTCDVEMLCTAEYDGMVRFSLQLKPKGKVGRLALEFPIKSANATRFAYHAAGDQGLKTGELAADKQDVIFCSRMHGYWSAVWQAKRAKQPEPKFEDTKTYAFLTQLDINDRNRGLFWFADNAAGWSQSKTTDTHQIVRRGDAVVMVLNFVAEPAELKDTRPIVFGILPHPARPMPEKYRLYERAAPKDEPKACSIYDAFKPWPMNPRESSLNMALFPSADREKRGDKTPSWEYAERCKPMMKQAKRDGYRTMYLSKYWFSCRAGAYDNWEWRSGPTGQCTLSQSFVDYLCWEMNEWIGRDIFDAIYLDECYEAPSKNVEAGQAIVLPDGTVQAGETHWGYRQLMKRWRNIFHQHNKEPLVIAHLTGSFMYHGNVFCDSYLDGENTPMVTANSKDFVDQRALHRLEGIQNGGLWGVSAFYMPSVLEKGFDDKESNPHKRWSWRMARGVMSALAHFEVGTTYDNQGAKVYKDYWNDVLRWGAGDAPGVPFHPYWNNSQYLQVEGQGRKALVSFYKKDNRLLLIASNRTEQAQELRIKLDRKALGLSAKQIKLWDTGHTPAPGEDIQAKAEREKDARAGFEKSLEGKDVDSPDELLVKDLEDTILNDDPAKKPGEARWEGDDTLVLPVRKKDFLMVSVE